MTTPQPPVELQGHCSVVDRETLYTYQSNAFQSLPLKEGASWTALPMGVSVEGAVCVRAVPNGDETQAALYIVGGTATDSKYSGLQRYTFSTKRWETITPVTTVTQNRQCHGAAYLNSTSSILVYGGSQQQSSGPSSSQTFSISIEPPYNVLAFESQAPAAQSPILLPWNNSHAAMMGGASTNTQVWLFSQDGGWSEFGTGLAQGIQSAETATIVSGGDGSKVLEIYDTSVSPNNVSEYVLLNAGGSPASTGETPGKSRKRKRDSSLANWPAYNDTLAPTIKRTGSSIAQDSNGLAVISGGNTQEPVSLFNQQENSWLNASQFFGTSDASTQSTNNPSGTPSIILPSSSATPSSTPAFSSNPTPPKADTLTVLGATLGAIFGIAAILLFILLLFRWHKAKRKRSEPGTPRDEKDRLSFIDRGASFMKEAGGSMANLHDTLKAPYGKNGNTASATSLTSLAIIAGRLNPAHHNGHKRGLSRGGSVNSTTALVQKKPHPLANAEVMEMDRFDEKSGAAGFQTRRQMPDGTTNPIIPVPAPTRQAAQPRTYDTPAPAQKQRSSGWSRYFNGNEVTDLAHMHANDRSTYASATDSRSSAASRSNYTDSRHHPSSVDMVAPLELPDTGAQFDGNRINSVVTGSTSLNQSREDLPQAQRAQIGMTRPESEASEASESILSSRPRSPLGEEPTGWTPGALASKDERGGSSIYTSSMRGSAVPGGAVTAANIGRLRGNTVTSSVYPASNRDTMDHDFPRPPSNTGASGPAANWPRGPTALGRPPSSNLRPSPEPRYLPAPTYPQAQSGRGGGAPWIYGGGTNGRGPNPGGLSAPPSRGLYDGSGWGGSGGTSPAGSIHRDSDASAVSHHVYNGVTELRPSTAGSGVQWNGGAGRLAPGRDRSSSDTVWPSTSTTLGGSGREQSRVDDMSWLNLNGENGSGPGRR
ncbi:MAG: hypothetical protein M1822_006058 [Bathelium mastoideum]|nr:MAG: hypothetical protein M1822_006058 [Bathelium mastoideum]